MFYILKKIEFFFNLCVFDKKRIISANMNMHTDNDDIQKLIIKNNELNEKNNELNEKVSEMNSVILAREDDIETLWERIRRFEKRISSDAEELGLLRLKYNACQEDFETMVGVRGKLESELKKKDEQIVKLKNEIKGLNNEYEDKIELLEDYIDNLMNEKRKLCLRIDNEEEKVIHVYVCCVCFIIMYIVYVFISDLDLYI